MSYVLLQEHNGMHRSEFHGTEDTIRKMANDMTGVL